MRVVDGLGAHWLFSSLFPSYSNKVVCHAVACSETVSLAQLVARQRSSKKKMGRQVNCQMRLKNTSPVTLTGKPRQLWRACLCERAVHLLSESLGREGVSRMGGGWVVPVGSSWEWGVLWRRMLVLASHGQRGSPSGACV